MKVKIVYGCSCAGKSTYVKAHAGANDLIWDYDKILMACTDRNDQLCPGHAMAGIIKSTRKFIIDSAAQNSNVETLWIPTLWISDKLREEISGLDVEEIFLDESKETCLERLRNADDRPDKKNWAAVISKWFEDHGEQSVQNRKVKMKIKIVYGAPCSGKSTYVKAHAGEHDLIWDFDKLLAACTNRTGQSSDQHPMANFVIDLRKMIIDTAQKRPSIENLYITTLWVSDKILNEVEGLDFEKIFIEATKEECFQRLEEDSERPDKGGWKKLINGWFSQHRSEDKPQSRAGRRKFWNFVRNETGERVLRIEGVIGEYIGADNEISPHAFREELNSGEGDITVWINSEGGDCWAGVQIYNMLKEYRGKVTIKIDAIAASAASIIAMAGDSIEISAAGTMMIHNPWSFVEGDAAQMESAATMLNEVKESIITAYELKTKMPREEISRMMDAETWLHAQKAVELGFADKIIGDETAPEIEISSRRQVMNCVTKTIKEKLVSKEKPKLDNRVDDEKKICKRVIKVDSRRRRLNLKLGGRTHE